MEASILNSTKKILGILEDYTVFDVDIITHINAAFSILNQIGVVPDDTMIEDSQPEWADLDIPQNQLNMVRTFVFLKVRILFDPPTTSFLIEAMNNQTDEFLSRLSYNRENAIPLVTTPVEEGGGEW